MLHRCSKAHTTPRSSSSSRKQQAASCQAVRAPAAPKRYLTLPTVTYSNAKEDINLLQLQQLYNRVVKQQNLASGTATQQSFFQHWEQLADEEAQQLLQRLLQKSVAVAAAFVRDPKLYSSMDEDSDDYDDASDSASIRSSSSSISVSSSSSSSSSSAGTWGPFAWRQRLPRRLVGFVRASGDHALVATIHDLIIHPDLQGFGLGSTLLRRLVAQISHEDVWDVGTVTPSHLQPFFHTCSFELDKEDSVPMALRRGWGVEVEQINAPLQANAQLSDLLQRATLLG